MTTHSSILSWEMAWRSLVGCSPWGCEALAFQGTTAAPVLKTHPCELTPDALCQVRLVTLPNP